MGTIAGNYNRQHSVNRRKSPAIAGDLPKRIVGLCPLGRAWWLALLKAICQSCSLQLCSPKINSPNEIILNKLYLNSIEFPEMNYKHFREKNAKFHIFLLLSIMGGISLITIYDRKFRHNRPEEGLPKMITYISPINMVAEDNHLYFAYKSALGNQTWIVLDLLAIRIQFYGIKKKLQLGIQQSAQRNFFPCGW